MPRRSLFRTYEFPYHLCARSNNKEWFDLDLRLCWEIYRHYLDQLSQRYEFLIHDFVLMSNHWHCNASTPLANVDHGMRYFMSESSREIARSTGRINRIYGSRYHWTVIGEPNHYAEAFRYLVMNPVKAEICESPYDYVWSTLTNTSITTVPCEGFDALIPKDPQRLLSWLLEAKEKDVSERVRKALRRAVFQFPRDNKTKRRFF